MSPQVAILVVSALVAMAAASVSLQPIVIVPGLGGSVLEAQLTNRSPYRDCETDSEWYTVWFSQSQGLLLITLLLLTTVPIAC